MKVYKVKAGFSSSIHHHYSYNGAFASLINKTKNMKEAHQMLQAALKSHEHSWYQDKNNDVIEVEVTNNV